MYTVQSIQIKDTCKLYCMPHNKVNVLHLFDDYGYGCATRYGGCAMGTVRGLRWPFVPTEVEEKWQYSFGKMIQNVSRF